MKRTVSRSSWKKIFRDRDWRGLKQKLPFIRKRRPETYAGIYTERIKYDKIYSQVTGLTCVKNYRFCLLGRALTAFALPVAAKEEKDNESRNDCDRSGWNAVKG